LENGDSGKMILIISTNKEKMHFYEFIKPVGDILIKNKIKGFIRHYSCLTKKDLQKATKIIITGTSLKDNEFLKDIKKFSWLKDYKNPVLGISFGLDRMMNLAKVKKEKEKSMIISVGRDREAVKLAEKLRVEGKSVVLFYGKPSKALGYANSKGINKVIFVGEKEVKSKKFKVKDMKSGKESLLNFAKF